MAWITPYTVAPRGRQRRAQTRYRVVFRHPTRLNARGERVETSRGGFKTLDVAEGWREQLERAEAMGTIEMLAVIEDRVGGDQGDARGAHRTMVRGGSAGTGGCGGGDGGELPADLEQPSPSDRREPLVAEFADPKTSLQVRAKLRQSGVGRPTQARAMKILSSALSWAVEVEGSLSVNGALALGGSDRRRRRRRSQRVVSRPSSPSAAAARALTAADVVAIQLEALARRAGRPARFAARDAAAIELIFGGGHRPQEIWGARWGDIDWPVGRRDRGVLWVNWVLSEGELADAKTEGSHRPAPLLPAPQRCCDGGERRLSRPGFRLGGTTSSSRRRTRGPPHPPPTTPVAGTMLQTRRAGRITKRAARLPRGGDALLVPARPHQLPSRRRRGHRTRRRGLRHIHRDDPSPLPAGARAGTERITPAGRVRQATRQGSQGGGGRPAVALQRSPC